MSYVTDVAAEFINAKTEAEQDKIIEDHRVGVVRKGLRHWAMKLEKMGEADAAAQAWALRDALTPEVAAEEVVHFDADEPFLSAVA